MIVVGFEDRKITTIIFFSCSVSSLLLFCLAMQKRIKVDFKVQFPFPCYVPKVTLLNSFKGSTWEVSGLPLCTWGHSHHTRPSGEVPCGGNGSVAVCYEKVFRWVGLGTRRSQQWRAACITSLCWGELLLLGCAEPSPPLLYCSQPREHWMRLHVVTGLEIELQSFNHKASPPSCLPLFLKSK